MLTRNFFSHKILNSHFLVSTENIFGFIDLNCAESLNFLNKPENHFLFKQPNQWFLFGNHSFLDNSYFGIDSKIFIAIEMNQTYQVKTIYKISRDFPDFRENLVGNWKKSQTDLQLFQEVSCSNRTNLMGTNINISYVITDLDSLNHLWDYRFKHIDVISKLNYILVHYLLNMLNATGTFLLQRTWGYRNDTTGLYSGMVGDLQNAADIGGTPLFLTIERMEIIDYIASTNPTVIKFLFKAPPLSYVTNIFTLPFDTTVWHCSFLMVSIMVIVVYIIVVWEWRSERFREVLVKEGGLEPKFSDVVMLEIGAISQQGTDKEPKSVSGRIATLLIFLVLMFFYVSFSANIVVLLQSTTNSIRTLEDLLNARIKLGVEDIIYNHHYFETAEDATRKAIYEQKVAPKGQKAAFMDIEEGIKRVRTEFFGFHVELTRAYQIINAMYLESEKCSLKEILYINVIEPWLALKKNSTYKEIIKISMRKMHETGIQNREISRLYVKKPTCQSGIANFGSVGLIDCYSAFLIFGLGVISAILLVICEKILHKTHKLKL